MISLRHTLQNVIIQQDATTRAKHNLIRLGLSNEEVDSAMLKIQDNQAKYIICEQAANQQLEVAKQAQDRCILVQQFLTEKRYVQFLQLLPRLKQATQTLIACILKFGVLTQQVTERDFAKPQLELLLEEQWLTPQILFTALYQAGCYQGFDMSKAKKRFDDEFRNSEQLTARFLLDDTDKLFGQLWTAIRTPEQFDDNKIIFSYKTVVRAITERPKVDVKPVIQFAAKQYLPQLKTPVNIYKRPTHQKKQVSIESYGMTVVKAARPRNKMRKTLKMQEIASRQPIHSAISTTIDMKAPKNASGENKEPLEIDNDIVKSQEVVEKSQSLENSSMSSIKNSPVTQIARPKIDPELQLESRVEENIYELASRLKTLQEQFPLKEPEKQFHLSLPVKKMKKYIKKLEQVSLLIINTQAQFNIASISVKKLKIFLNTNYTAEFLAQFTTAREEIIKAIKSLYEFRQIVCAPLDCQFIPHPAAQELCSLITEECFKFSLYCSQLASIDILDDIHYNLNYSSLLLGGKIDGVQESFPEVFWGNLYQMLGKEYHQVEEQLISDTNAEFAAIDRYRKEQTLLESHGKFSALIPVGQQPEQYDYEQRLVEEPVQIAQDTVFDEPVMNEVDAALLHMPPLLSLSVVQQQLYTAKEADEGEEQEESERRLSTRETATPLLERKKVKRRVKIRTVRLVPVKTEAVRNIRKRLFKDVTITSRIAEALKAITRENEEEAKRKEELIAQQNREREERGKTMKAVNKPKWERLLAKADLLDALLEVVEKEETKEDKETVETSVIQEQSVKKSGVVSQIKLSVVAPQPLEKTTKSRMDTSKVGSNETFAEIRKRRVRSAGVLISRLDAK